MAEALPEFFDRDWYLATNPDVAAARMPAERHYLRYGRHEGRMPCLVTAAFRERDLRRGLLEGGVAALDALMAPETGDGAGCAPERAWASVAAARWAAAQGDWHGAAQTLRALDARRDLVTGFGRKDPSLLAIEAALVTGDTARARDILRHARQAFGMTPDLALAAANIAAADTGFATGWQRAMARLFARAGLRGVRVERGDRTAAFDRLHGRGGGRWQRMTWPQVSVIMPALNASTSIATALRSLCAQSWRNLEILVVDNGSTDATPAIAAEWAARESRIRVIDATAQPGAYPARNAGLAEAQGDFITVLDADDWAHPARIARQVRALLRQPRRAASVSSWVRATPGLRFTRWWGEDGLVHRNVSSLMIRAGLRETLGYWDRARAGADTEYVQRVLAAFGSDAIAEVSPGVPLSFGRVAEGSLTRAPATSIRSQYAGPRRDYGQAAQRWHARADDDHSLYLARHPERRPFAIPKALALGDAPAPLQPEDEIAHSGVYDDAWYLRSYPDLRARDLDGARHYLATGAGEGRDPGPGFSSSGYRLMHDIGSENPLMHYLREGRARGLTPLPDFDGALAPPGDNPAPLFFAHQAGAQVFGAERSLLDMLDKARAAGAVPSVVLPQIMNAGYLDDLRARSHRVHIRPYGWLYGGVAPASETVALLAGLIRDSGAHEVHQNTAVLDAPLRAARVAGVASVVHVRELPAQDPELCRDLGLRASDWRRHLLDHADRFVANSQAVADWLDTGPERCTIQPNTIDPALFDLPFAPADPPRVALVGSLSAKKGLHDFIALAQAMAAKRVAAQFVLIGPLSPELAALGPLPANVTHAGYAPGPAAAIAQADIVLSISGVAESYGRSVHEAMAAGRPVICYGRGTPPVLLGPDGAGAVVAPDDRAALADALRAMLETPGDLQRRSAVARARAQALLRPGRADDRRGGG